MTVLNSFIVVWPISDLCVVFLLLKNENEFYDKITTRSHTARM